LLVWVILIIGGLILALNLVRLQVFQASKLQEQARQQQVSNFRSFVPRRSIVDRQGNVLAMDQSAYTLYAHPILFKQDREAIASQLTPILEKPTLEILNQFNQGKSGIRLQDALPQDKADRITQLQLDGLELVQQPQRVYPQQDLFADILGYVDVDGHGQAGVEFSQNQLLEPTLPKDIQLSRSGDGTVLLNDLPDQFLNQDDLRLQLSLDSRLQRAARSALHQKIEEFNAKRGAVLVINAQTGELLSMAVEPTFDPNEYYRFTVDHFRNWAISDLIEPGSTFKPINVAIALETKAITPDSVFEDEGQIEVGGWPIQNYDYETRGGRGSQSVRQILEHSSNVGMVHIIQQMKPSVYYEWLEKIGLAKATGIDLPFETSGQMKSREQFLGASIEPATTAFGQGFSLTPLQLVQLHAALANGGKLITPHVVRGLVDSDGKFNWQPTVESKPLFSEAIAHSVIAMMEAVVKDGTGQPAQIPGYRIAGKTGTAQKASPDGGYYDHARITSFVGTFPAEAPRYVTLVVIDEPQGDDAYGSTVSAPIAKTVMETLINIEQLPPDAPVSDQATPEQQ
jgi:cell division protein FtsI (penicillin-binding protein 3)